MKNSCNKNVKSVIKNCLMNTLHTIHPINIHNVSKSFLYTLSLISNDCLNWNLKNLIYSIIAVVKLIDPIPFFFPTVPPQQPNIYNERRMRIDSRAGPYEEGGSLEVTCVVYGGKYCLRKRSCYCSCVARLLLTKHNQQLKFTRSLKS